MSPSGGRAGSWRGLGGRAVSWGWLQAGSEFDTADYEVITGEDSNACAVIPRNARTEINCTAVFLRGVALPKRGAKILWVNAEGTVLSARVLNRRFLYNLGTVAVVSIAATKWEGMP